LVAETVAFVAASKPRPASSIPAHTRAGRRLMPPSKRNSKARTPVKNVDLKFLLLAALMLTLGVGLGIRMGIVHDFSLAPVHAHINLVGWASLALFGIVYRLYPAMAESRLAGLHFILAAPAAVMFPIGIALSILAERPLVAIVASLFWFAGVLLFLVNLVRQAFRSMPAAQPVLVPAE
jgi:hypothetical protein